MRRRCEGSEVDASGKGFAAITWPHSAAPIARLQKAEVLAKPYAEVKAIVPLVSALTTGDKREFLKGARVMNLLEFGRAFRGAKGYVPALKERCRLLKTEIDEKLPEVAHLNEVVSSHVDASQQRYMRSHGMSLHNSGDGAAAGAVWDYWLRTDGAGVCERGGALASSARNGG